MMNSPGTRTTPYWFPTLQSLALDRIALVVTQPNRGREFSPRNPSGSDRHDQAAHSPRSRRGGGADRVRDDRDRDEGNGTTLAAELGNLFSGNLYINAHTGDHPAGEIRGLIAVPAPPRLVLIVVAIAGIAGVSLRRRIA